MKIQFQFMMINHVLLSNVREVRGKGGGAVALGGECLRFTIRKEEYFIPKSVKKRIH